MGGNEGEVVVWLVVGGIRSPAVLSRESKDGTKHLMRGFHAVIWLEERLMTVSSLMCAAILRPLLCNATLGGVVQGQWEHAKTKHAQGEVCFCSAPLNTMPLHLHVLAAQ